MQKAADPAKAESEMRDNLFSLKDCFVRLRRARNDTRKYRFSTTC
jgi:hypothetical protein